MAQSGLQAIRSAFAHRNFRYYTTGNVCSHMGTWIQRVAMGWLAWDLTHSGFWLGLVAFADLAPTVFLAPICGVVADRVDRLKGMRATQTLAMVQATTLCVMMLSDVMTIEWLTALAVANGVIMAFNQPIRFSIIPSLVDRRNLTAAIGINSISFNFARIGGPAASGFLIAHYGAATAFGVNALSYVIFLATLTTVRLETGAAREPRPMRAVPAEMLEGIRYCLRTPGIAPMFFLLSVVAVLGRAYSELLPGFADRVFDYGVAGFSMLTSSAGFGAMVGSIFLAQRGSVAGLMRLVTINVFVLGAALVGFTATTSIWVGMGCVMFAGFAMLSVGVGEQTLLQNTVAGEIRGRVMSLYGMISRGGPAVGALIMGTASEVVGLRWPVFIGALCCLALGGWALTRAGAMAEVLEGEPDET